MSTLAGMKYKVKWIEVPKDGSEIEVDGTIIAVLEDRGFQFRAVVETGYELKGRS